jgi:hypothetical protein
LGYAGHLPVKGCIEARHLSYGRQPLCTTLDHLIFAGKMIRVEWSDPPQLCDQLIRERLDEPPLTTRMHDRSGWLDTITSSQNAAGNAPDRTGSDRWFNRSRSRSGHYNAAIAAVQFGSICSSINAIAHIS